MMFVKKNEYIEPQIEIIKFGSEDIITESANPDPEDNTDPWVEDNF